MFSGREGEKCHAFYCGVRLRKSGSAMRTRDHVVPKSKGGYKTVEACVKCNGAKAALSLHEFRIKCGGIEFWGEQQSRIEREKTAWIHEFKTDSPAPPREKRTIVAQDGNRPTYKATFDLSKIKQYTRGAITKQERKEESQENNLSTSHIPPDFLGVKFGLLTVVRRITGKWEVKCACGTIENRSSKAVRNPANTFDACIECRKPLGELRSKVYRETGVELAWEECFRRIYGGQEESCESTNRSMKLELTREAEEMCL